MRDLAGAALLFRNDLPPGTGLRRETPDLLGSLALSAQRVHVLIPAAGVSTDGSHWIDYRNDPLPVPGNQWELGCLSLPALSTVLN